MNNLEKLADDLGQAIFAAETNLHTLQRHGDGTETAKQAGYGAQRGLERMKDLKVQLEKLAAENATSTTTHGHAATS